MGQDIMKAVYWHNITFAIGMVIFNFLSPHRVGGFHTRCMIQIMSSRFEIGKADFLLNGEPIRLLCGELHFARIPRAYWAHRLQMLKAMGCNTVAVYLFLCDSPIKRGFWSASGRDRMCVRSGRWAACLGGY